ncbi:hypothetical protein [Bacillus sp. Hm123]|uniref:hypothetical protein n=1 Tax=Bacillus sp. Hm123 TaxID=3450745 RepID=UPI003F43C6C3
MKRIYSFRVGQHPKERKFYTFFAKHSIPRKIEYPFKVPMSEMVEAVVISDNVQQFFSVVIEVEDVTYYPLDEVDVIEAYRVDETSIKDLELLDAHEIDIKNIRAAFDVNTRLITDGGISITNDFLEVGQNTSVDASNVRDTQEALLIDQSRSVESHDVIAADMYTKNNSTHIIPTYDTRVIKKDSSYELPVIYDASVVQETAIFFNSEIIYDAEEINVASSQSEMVINPSVKMNIDASSLGETPLLVDIVRDERFVLYAYTADEIKMDAFSSSITIKESHFCSDSLFDNVDIILASKVLKEGCEQMETLILTSEENVDLSCSVASILDAENRSPESHLHIENYLATNKADQESSDLITRDLYAENIIIDAADVHNDSICVADVIDIDNSITKDNGIDAASVLLDTLNYASSEVQLYLIDSDSSENGNNHMKTSITLSDNLVYCSDTDEIEMVNLDTIVDKSGIKDAVLYGITNTVSLEKVIDAEPAVVDGNQQYAIDANEVKNEAIMAKSIEYEARIEKDHELDESDRIIVSSNLYVPNSLRADGEEIESVQSTIETLSLQENIISMNSMDHDLLSFSSKIEAETVNLFSISSEVEIDAEITRETTMISESVTLSELVVGSQLSSDNLLKADMVVADSSLIYKVVDVDVQCPNEINSETEISATVTGPGDFKSSPVVSVSLKDLDNLIANSVIETEAIQLTESEWLSDIPTDMINDDPIDKVEEIETKKRIWLIPARANWYSKWFNKKTR